MTHNITAIVPIKEHSKRLPNKNFRDFNGKPLYHWILDTLSSVDEINKIVVNTDSERILENGQKVFDIEVSERPERLIGDPTTRNIIKYEVNRNSADTYIQTYCTSPLLEASTISSALQKYIESEKHDSLFTVTKHQIRLYDENLEPINHDPAGVMRTQDVDPVYEDNSSMYIYGENIFKKQDHTIGAVPIGEYPIAYEMNKIEAIDIDVKSDFEMAEYFHKNRFSNA